MYTDLVVLQDSSIYAPLHDLIRAWLVGVASVLELIFGKLEPLVPGECSLQPIMDWTPSRHTINLCLTPNYFVLVSYIHVF